MSEKNESKIDNNLKRSYSIASSENGKKEKREKEKEVNKKKTNEGKERLKKRRFSFFLKKPANSEEEKFMTDYKV